MKELSNSVRVLSRWTIERIPVWHMCSVSLTPAVFTLPFNEPGTMLNASYASSNLILPTSLREGISPLYRSGN